MFLCPLFASLRLLPRLALVRISMLRIHSNTSTMESTPPVAEEAPYPAFTHIPPQSWEEVIHKASVLFHSLVTTPPQLHSHSQPTSMRDADAADDIAAAALPDSKFCHVALTARLINSYMSMFY